MCNTKNIVINANTNAIIISHDFIKNILTFFSTKEVVLETILSTIECMTTK